MEPCECIRVLVPADPTPSEIVSLFLSRVSTNSRFELSGVFDDTEDIGSTIDLLQKFTLRYEKGELRIHVSRLTPEYKRLFEGEFPIESLELDTVEIPTDFLPLLQKLDLQTLYVSRFDVLAPLLQNLRLRTLVFHGSHHPEDLIKALKSVRESLTQIQEVRGVGVRKLDDLQELVPLFPALSRFSFQGPPTYSPLGESISRLFPSILFFQELRGSFQNGERAPR